jgi:ATP-dependent DNA helicase RecG
MDVAKDREFSKGLDRRSPPENAIDPLFSPVITLPAIGPRLALAFDRLLGGERRTARRLDLLLHLPHRVVDYQQVGAHVEPEEGAQVTLRVRVLGHRPPFKSRQPYRVHCDSEIGPLELVFFRGRPGYLQGQFPEGAERQVSARLGRYGKTWQMAHPDVDAPVTGSAAGRGNRQPVYPSTAGLHQKSLQRAVAAALDDLPHLLEWQDPAWLQAKGWPDVKGALEALHRPAEDDDDGAEHARRRLAYDELLASQLLLALTRQRRTAQPSRVLAGDGGLRAALRARLPFALTAAQEGALAEILGDMARPERMRRLLQGDVGSGKTVVAALAMLQAIEAGSQAALMAPTEVLARQHAERLAALLQPIGIEVGLLTGRERAAGRKRLLQAIATAEAQIVIGTHALFQPEVRFADLGLVVIDEQHRFGVDQRMELGAKGIDADMLLMTATPIPRTMVLSCYGDITLSELREKPAGRKPIRTRALALGKLGTVIQAIGRAIEAGEQVYWVCPLVEPSEGLEVRAAVERYQALAEAFGEQVALVHGQMPARDKDRAMAAFAAGDCRLLVATTVIEVGVDVANATVMVIEHAERFGLAQLHQLRGRVGRSARPSSCLLLYADALGSQARARLDIMRRTEDGFEIAEEDLRLRGPGEVLGTRQSGLPDFRIADLTLHGDLLLASRDDAKLIMQRDPELLGERGLALRELLRWFEQEKAAAYLRSG